MLFTGPPNYRLSPLVVSKLRTTPPQATVRVSSASTCVRGMMYNVNVPEFHRCPHDIHVGKFVHCLTSHGCRGLVSAISTSITRVWRTEDEAN